jgi:regulator of protease activity HflC (stomatin/prohibitin superfamily)
MIIVALIVAVIAVVALIVGAVGKQGGFLLGGALAGIAALVLGVFSMAYTQNAGEAKVIVSFSGEVKGQDTTEGLDWHAPFDHLVDYDTRNKQAAFSNQNNTKLTPEELLGGELDFTDKNGVTGKMDIFVVYSLKESDHSIEDIFTRYGDQKKFEGTLISPEVKTVVKEVPGSFTTTEMRTDRAKVGTAIEKALKARWENKGVIVDSIQIQDIRYSDSVNNSYADAQNARTKITTEQANLEAAKISSQQKIVQAEADKKANDLVNKSLTPEVLQLRGYEMLEKAAEKGNVIFTDGSTVTQFPLNKK